MTSSVRLPHRLDVARLPTPIVRLERLSKAWGGPNLWVKRDDDTAGVLTGNKIRKLQYAVAEALAAGADTLVTCGSLQSNHCRATAALARRFGLDVHLLLRGEPPERLEGNYLLMKVFGAQMQFCSPEEYRRNEPIMAEMADRLRAAGRAPYVIAEGCSMPIGSFGYIEACEEIARAEQQLDVEFTAIVHAVGSGGTSAGLELGRRLYGLRAPILGINICDDATYFRDLVGRLCAQTQARFDLKVTVDPSELQFIDGYVGDASTRPDELATAVEVARLEGLVLEPVYTAKAMHGLRREIERGRFSDRDDVLFIHTGGVFGLFPYADAIPV